MAHHSTTAKCVSVGWQRELQHCYTQPTLAGSRKWVHTPVCTVVVYMIEQQRLREAYLLCLRRGCLAGPRKTWFFFIKRGMYLCLKGLCWESAGAGDLCAVTVLLCEKGPVMLMRKTSRWLRHKGIDRKICTYGVNTLLQFLHKICPYIFNKG